MPIQIRIVIPGSDEASENDGVEEKEDAPKANGPQTARSSGRIHTARRGVTVRPASAPVRRSHLQVPVKPHDISMHVASIYDVQNEHAYIMDKALQAYTKHRLEEQEGGGVEGGGTTNRDQEEEGGGGWGGGGGGKNTPRPQSARQHNNNNTNHHHHHNNNNSSGRTPNRRRRLLSASSTNSSRSTNDGRASPTPSTSSSFSALGASDRKKAFGGFKLALCTLKDALGNEPRPVPHTYSSPGPGYLPLKRPWSALPSGRLDAIREVSLANNVMESARAARAVHQHRLPNTSRSASAVPATSRMDPPITRSNAYHIRNRTTHSWAASSPTSPQPPPSSLGEDPPGSMTSSTTSSSSSRVVLPIDQMTMSCPNARSLEEHMRNARAFHGVPRDPNPSPVIVKGRASIVSPSSPQPPPSAVLTARGERPVSAYSYDGGMFLSASNSGKDYFVIHPDWVTEAMTVQKLSLNERQGRSAVRTVGPAAGRRDYYGRRRIGGRAGGDGDRGMEDDGDGPEGEGRRIRRCKSAPPSKHRNPITWSS